MMSQPKKIALLPYSRKITVNCQLYNFGWWHPLRWEPLSESRCNGK